MRPPRRPEHRGSLVRNGPDLGLGSDEAGSGSGQGHEVGGFTLRET